MVTVFAHWTGGEIGLTMPDVHVHRRQHELLDFALGFMTVSGLILYGLSRSSAGLILQACGQDPFEAQALGFNVSKHKLAAFMRFGPLQRPGWRVAGVLLRHRLRPAP